MGIDQELIQTAPISRPKNQKGKIDKYHERHTQSDEQLFPNQVVIQLLQEVTSFLPNNFLLMFNT